ncbi:DUF2332 domain-containing protein [Actinomadura madurae]|nr:DUF2332 domain-containing protein [Actinomadura madurae]MCP9971689.1 DUF2332 domain-containing protein [Actinomadura madurae]MCP9984193.1 DUF2332 domain-containing protein [Actinomadura madurae]
MRRVLLAQAQACADLGSPMYAELLTRAADDPGEAVADVLEGRTGPGFVLGMLGTVHRLVLEGRVPELAAHYPTAGGTADPLEAWPAFRDVLAAHAAEIRDGLADPPQTNEVGRAAPLVGGLLAVAEAARLPVRLLEIGASAGLNLRADRFRLLHETGSYGPESPVVLPGAWRGLPPVDAPLAIAERRGCDPHPLDAASAGARRRLLSYVWPDQTARVERLRAAFEVAAQVPAAVVRAGAAEFLDGLAPVRGSSRSCGTRRCARTCRARRAPASTGTSRTPGRRPPRRRLWRTCRSRGATARGSTPSRSWRCGSGPAGSGGSSARGRRTGCRSPGSRRSPASRGRARRGRGRRRGTRGGWRAGPGPRP